MPRYLPSPSASLTEWPRMHLQYHPMIPLSSTLLACSRLSTFGVPLSTARSTYIAFRVPISQPCTERTTRTLRTLI